MNVNLQLHSAESDPNYAPSLSLWSEAGEVVIQEKTDEPEDEKEEVVEEQTPATINLDIVDVNEALDLLNYELLAIQSGLIELPLLIGKDVQIEWMTNNDKVLSNTGVVGQAGKDVTLTAILRKGVEITEKPFIIVTE